MVGTWAGTLPGMGFDGQTEWDCRVGLVDPPVPRGPMICCLHRQQPMIVDSMSLSLSLTHTLCCIFFNFLKNLLHDFFPCEKIYIFLSKLSVERERESCKMGRLILYLVSDQCNGPNICLPFQAQEAHQQQLTVTRNCACSKQKLGTVPLHTRYNT